ncbi:TonB-dependent receptor [Dysgonomonas sp. Marseille-P4677]|uniref:SusC/RagA family TonB-linked outer membrane protein n=1 Tax=Dysgonomonas sp. Marseille-P4677 TaxID=2364790 RepID=UPI0019137C12|nr:TonB-dependent receptor [Dysgonomonas sp. Marseille-P4677]MBK5721951.1 TonB-dependent receptor [Dysgonomonas sp. Marseille-P4677]
MKIACIFFILSIGSIFATNTHSQEAKLSIAANKMKVSDLIKIIEKETGYLFVYNESEVDTNRTVAVSYNQEELKEILHKVFDPVDIDFAVEGKGIMLKKKAPSASPLNINAPKVQNDKITVTGNVKDHAGIPVIGVSITLEGAKATGTITDIDGNYSLQVPRNGVLIFSYIGYQKQTVSIKGQTVINVTLEEDFQYLEEVVVVGYGVQKKANLTGAVDQVTSEVFENRPVSNATQMLQGAIPNLTIRLTDGKPGATADFQVRGKSSIGQQGSALVLIDGVEGDPAMLNPNDIESVSVLKDAASAAIYGARGSFGVILITTKSPQEGRFSINYSGNFSVRKPVDVPDVVSDGYVFAERFYEAYSAWNNYSAVPKNINKSQTFSLAWLEEFKRRKEQGITDEVEILPTGEYVYYGNTDYYGELYKKNVFAQDHNVSINGNSGKLNYFLSGRFNKYDGLFRYNTDEYQTIDLRAKGSIQVFNWLRIDNNMSYSNMGYYNPQNVGEGGAIWRNIADEGHPSSPLFNPDGTMTMSAAYTIGDFIYGKNGRDIDRRLLKNTSSFRMSFLDKKLQVNGDITFSNNDYKRSSKRVPVPYSKNEGAVIYLSEKYNDLEELKRETQYLATNIYAQYDHTFNKAHNFKLMAGWNYEEQTYDSQTVQRNGLFTPDSENINLALGDAITTSASYNKWRVAGGFFRLNYDYKSRYLLEINGRYDGSSKFPAGQQWEFFPSISGGWRVSEEKFWGVNPMILSDLKFRASYGSLGNGNISPYSFMELLSISTSGRVLDGAKNKILDTPAVLPSGLTWETATTTDVGIDLGAVNGKLRFTGDYYIRKTKDMYTVGKTLPEIFGASSPKGNYADMTTRGWEIALGWNDKLNLAGKPLNYSVRATLSDYKTKIDRYNNETMTLDDYYEGQTYGEIWGYVTEGLFQSQAEIDAHATQKLFKSSTNGTWYPGDVKIKDLDNSGAVDYGKNTVLEPGDKKIIGNTEPRYMYSFNLSADWNNIFVSTFFEGVGRQHWYPTAESLFWGQYNRPYNMLPTWHLDNYWTESNPGAYLPRYSGYNQSLRGISQTRYLQNVAYLRLKNLQIGYTLPKQISQKVSAQSIKIYFSGENLYCWSPLYKHTRDIDVANIYGSDRELTSGTSGDGYNYPFMKSFSLGLSVTF